MASLQVLSAPTNQPTLNPRVQSAPVRPTLSPRVVSAPQQPVLAPRVVSQPQQPTLAPRVISQPQGQQASLPVSYGRVIDSIVSAKARGADSQTILQAIITQNQNKAAVFQEALSRGATPEQILDKIIQDNYIPSGQETSQEGVRGLKGFGVGAAKGVASTLNSISQLGQKALQKVTGIRPPTASLNEEITTPYGTAEKFGFGTEQVAEFFIPAGTTTKAIKAAEAGINTLRAGKAVKTALKVGIRSTITAGEAAGVTALQGGDKSEVKTAAAFGASFSVIAKGIDKLIQKLPDTAWTAILKRTPTEAAKNPNLPAQAAKSGLAGTSRKVILEKSQQAIQAIETTLDDLLSKSKGTINTAKVAGYLSDLRNSYAVIPGEKASVDAIDNIATELFQGFKQGKALTLVEANQLKRNIYNIIAKSYGKGSLEIPAKTEAQKIIAAGLKQEIEKVIPEVKALNQKQAVYLQVKKAIEKALARTEGKGIGGTGIGLYDLLVGGIGTGAGLATGNPLLGLGFVAAKKTVESTAILSGVSKLINYFNQLSPTKKMLFYNALKGLTIKGGVGITISVSPQTTK